MPSSADGPALDVVVVAGNPRPGSRTLQAALAVAERLAGQPPQTVVDLIEFGAALLDPSDASVNAAIGALRACDLAVIASPTYKGSYTGLLKLFLDRIAAGELAGVTAVPFMLGGDLRHSLASDVLLKPILVELGATCPTRGLFVVDSRFADEDAYDDWLDLAGRQIAATAGRLR
jgi:FMN reductase